MAKRTEAHLSPISNNNGEVRVSTFGTKAAPGSKLVSYKISWGDGTASSGVNPPRELSHDYLKNGNYTIILNVKDSKNRIAEDTMGMIVQINSGIPPTPIPPGWLVQPTVIATSCSQADVETAISLATDGSGIVGIPAGNCTWLSTISTAKSIGIIGRGFGTKTQCQVPSQTDYTCINGAIQLLSWDVPNTGNPRLGGITFYSDDCPPCAAGGAYSIPLVNIFGDASNFRLHDLGIDVGGVNGYTGLIIGESVRGVGWNINGIQRTQIHHIVLVLHQSWLSVGNNGDNSWAEPSTIGTQDAWYWEDIELGIADFSSIGFCTDDFMGARVVYRFSNFPNCSLQNHGTETGGRLRGYREVDYYRNIATNNLQAWPGAFAFRGAGYYGWQNSFNTSGAGSYTRTLEGTTFRRDDTSHGDGSWSPWGGCGTQSITSITRSGNIATVTLPGHKVSCSGSYVVISGADQPEYNGTYFATKVAVAPCHEQLSVTFEYEISGTPVSPATGTLTVKSPFDGNSDVTGRLCLDGFGTGFNPLISGDAPPFGNISPLTGFGANAQPVYGWLNRLNGSQTNITAAMDFVQANRDLYNENTSYNGTTQRGVFVGTSLPVNCTVGDAAWITNQGSWNLETAEMHANHGSNHTFAEQGKRYECTSTNVWTARYGINNTGEPLTYPHPLRNY